ncbi:DUF2291 family protein [Aureimonas frigidaquae]|uniref:Lipoprotein n=1 Tax=Aureimonas frigidaquae TaxID=424757 RepID=A0A0P0Z2Z8_9HYPH|nr:DUF2291 domain-containing protein [Aureimonas frigidaquae]BAT28474.1 lipoprotein [Aureimonas frigidaquae]
MTTKAVSAPTQRGFLRPRNIVLTVAGLALVAAMALDTTVVEIGADSASRAQGFSAQTYGPQEFPRIQTAIEGKAADAVALATQIAQDKDAAVAAHGTPSGVGPVMAVTFTGVAGEARSGVYTVAIDGMPEGTNVRVQTGPAINGTELRDAPGDIAFGQFTNQIEYQNAGAALNDEMKRQVLEGVDTTALTGKTIEVTGVFRLINPKNWLVTPVRMAVR